MKLFKSPLRRTTAALAGAVLGLAGAAAFAAPASAHHPEVAPESSCVNEDGTWQVKWTVTNSESDLEGEILRVNPQPEGSTVSGITAGDTLPKANQGMLTAVQQLPASATEAELRVKVKWVRDGNPIEGWRAGKTGTPTEKCVPTEPSTPPTEPSTPPTEPSTPPTKPSTPPTEPSTPAEPSPIFEVDCTSMTIGLDNPEDGDDITLLLTTSKGEKRTLSVKPGEKKSEKFSATPGFTVTITAEGFEGSETVPYEQPADCAGGGAGGGELPLTGAAAGGIAGGAALLLGAGALMFVMSRRRKVKFTA